MQSPEYQEARMNLLAGLEQWRAEIALCLDHAQKKGSVDLMYYRRRPKFVTVNIFKNDRTPSIHLINAVSRDYVKVRHLSPNPTNPPNILIYPKLFNTKHITKKVAQFLDENFGINNLPIRVFDSGASHLANRPMAQFDPNAKTYHSAA